MSTSKGPKTMEAPNTKASIRLKLPIAPLPLGVDVVGVFELVGGVRADGVVPGVDEGGDDEAGDGAIDGTGDGVVEGGRDPVGAGGLLAAAETETASFIP
eukprot:TRINITY_DN12969_c3_g1_i1.p2 TRINITY_DN12969_c3_g1~~TRINITY_DN12969_c3_g1_i1.p2  ORF type:complete len:100 (-),score=23.24 TRINITY_DN12969_c3_g1_i1:425-724(-)